LSSDLEEFVGALTESQTIFSRIVYEKAIRKPFGDVGSGLYRCDCEPSQTISMPNVKGRLDHLHVDVGSKRLFVAGLENGSVEVVDLKAAKWLRTIPGFQKPPSPLAT
jgi:hypothetical protein